MSDSDPHDVTRRATDAAGFDPQKSTRLAESASSKFGVPPEVEAAPASAHFGKFVCVSLLGQGGMGEVWKAWDSALRRWVALKLPMTRDTAELALFQREAELAGRLSHPHIAAIYEVGIAQDRPFIAMQYVDGWTLRSFPVEHRRGLITLLRDAARALGYAHLHGVVHRDLKPGNLMYTRPPVARTISDLRTQSEFHVFVMDFGLAKPTGTDSELSLTGGLVGTLGFMPPEQAQTTEVDGRADVYALGATLYALLTGNPPVIAKNIYEYVTRVVDVEPIPPSVSNPSVDRDLERIILKCLDKAPARRYETADRLAEDLTRWLDGEPVRARPISFAARLVRKARRHPRTLVAAALLLAVSAATVGHFVARAARESARFELRQSAVRMLEVGEARATRARADYFISGGPFDPFFAAMKFAAAQASLASAADPAFADPHIAAGTYLRDIGESAAARAAFQRALALDSSNPVANLSLAEMAVEDAVTLLAAPPERSAHRVLFEQCSSRIAHHVKALGAAALEDLSVRDRVEGLRLFASGDLQAAARHFLDAAKHSSAPAPLRLYAFLMGAQGWVGIDGKDPIVVETRLALAQALQEMPLDPFALVCAALAAEDPDPSAAINLYDRAIARNPRCVLALYLRGHMRFKMVNTNHFTGGPLEPEAIEETWRRFTSLIEDDFRRVLELDDSLGYRFGIAQFHYVMTFRTLGSVLPLDLTHYHRVAAEYDAIFEAFPDLVQLHSERGGLAFFAADALEKQGAGTLSERLPEIVRILEASIASLTRSLPSVSQLSENRVYLVRSRSALTRVRLNAGAIDRPQANREWEALLAILDEAARMKPTSALPFLSRSRVLVLLERIEEAKSTLREAISDPKVFEFRENAEKALKDLDSR